MPKNHTVDTKSGKNSAINNGLKGLKSIFYKTKMFSSQKTWILTFFLRKKTMHSTPNIALLSLNFSPL